VRDKKRHTRETRLFFGQTAPESDKKKPGSFVVPHTAKRHKKVQIYSGRFFFRNHLKTNLQFVSSGSAKTERELAIPVNERNSGMLKQICSLFFRSAKTERVSRELAISVNERNSGISIIHKLSSGVQSLLCLSEQALKSGF